MATRAKTTQNSLDPYENPWAKPMDPASDPMRDLLEPRAIVGTASRGGRPKGSATTGDSAALASPSAPASSPVGSKPMPSSGAVGSSGATRQGEPLLHPLYDEPRINWLTPVMSGGQSASQGAPRGTPGGVLDALMSGQPTGALTHEALSGITGQSWVTGGGKAAGQFDAGPQREGIFDPTQGGAYDAVAAALGGPIERSTIQSTGFGNLGQPYIKTSLENPLQPQDLAQVALAGYQSQMDAAAFNRDIAQQARDLVLNTTQEGAERIRGEAERGRGDMDAWIAEARGIIGGAQEMARDQYGALTNRADALFAEVTGRAQQRADDWADELQDTSALRAMQLASGARANYEERMRKLDAAANYDPNLNPAAISESKRILKESYHTQLGSAVAEVITQHDHYKAQAQAQVNNALAQLEQGMAGLALGAYTQAANIEAGLAAATGAFEQVALTQRRLQDTAVTSMHVQAEQLASNGAQAAASIMLNPAYLASAGDVLDLVTSMYEIYADQLATPGYSVRGPEAGYSWTGGGQAGGGLYAGGASGGGGGLNPSGLQSLLGEGGPSGKLQSTQGKKSSNSTKSASKAKSS